MTKIYREILAQLLFVLDSSNTFGADMRCLGKNKSIFIIATKGLKKLIYNSGIRECISKITIRQ